MPRRFVDISVPLKAGIASDPPDMLPEIQYLDHHQTAPRMAEYMGVPVSALPEGEYAAVERVQISTHNGTHLDAPYHYFSRMNERLTPGGEPAWRIDEVPLEWCHQPGVKTATWCSPRRWRRSWRASGTRRSRWRSCW